MIKRTRVFDRFGREVDVDDDDDYVVEDGGYVRLSSIMFMDKRAPPTLPPGQYFLYDRAGRVAGIGSLDAADKARTSYEAYKKRLAGKWASPLTPPPAPPSSDPNSEVSASRAAYLKYVKRISSMYKAGNL